MYSALLYQVLESKSSSQLIHLKTTAVEKVLEIGFDPLRSTLVYFHVDTEKSFADVWLNPKVSYFNQFWVNNNNSNNFSIVLQEAVFSSIDLFVRPSVRPFVCLPICPSVRLSVYLSLCWSVNLWVCWSVGLSVHHSVKHSFKPRKLNENGMELLEESRCGSVTANNLQITLLQSIFWTIF